MKIDHSQFILPEGNVQICFSGGRTSAFLLHCILTANGGLPDRAIVVFTNTGREMPQTLDFVAEVGQRWGVLIDWVEYTPAQPLFRVVGRQGAAENGEPFEALIRRKKYLPNQQTRFCTTELKIRTAKRYLRSLGWDRWTNALGIRADEKHRSANPPKDRWVNWRPLVSANISKRHVEAFWNAQPFDLRLPNVKGNCWLGNCDGCFLKSEANVAALAREYPERAKWWEQMEKEVAALWPSLSRWARLRRIIRAEPEISSQLREAFGRPIPASVINSMTEQPRASGQFSKRYGREELRTFIEKQGDWIFSDDSFLCQADDGECTG